jgi:energy-converting hydrogenase Eha subunit C
MVINGAAGTIRTLRVQLQRIQMLALVHLPSNFKQIDASIRTLSLVRSSMTVVTSAYNLDSARLGVIFGPRTSRHYGGRDYAGDDRGGPQVS